jgi:hypothetical protein
VKETRWKLLVIETRAAIPSTHPVWHPWCFTLSVRQHYANSIAACGVRPSGAIMAHPRKKNVIKQNLGEYKFKSSFLFPGAAKARPHGINQAMQSAADGLREGGGGRTQRPTTFESIGFKFASPMDFS